MRIEFRISVPAPAPSTPGASSLQVLCCSPAAVCGGDSAAVELRATATGLEGRNRPKGLLACGGSPLAEVGRDGGTVMGWAGVLLPRGAVCSQLVDSDFYPKVKFLLDILRGFWFHARLLVGRGVLGAPRAVCERRLSAARIYFERADVMPSPLRDAAIRYAELGYPVLPCRPFTRHPQTLTGTRDPEAIWKLWDVEFPPNVAISTNGILVVRVEDKQRAALIPLAETGAPMLLGPGGAPQYFFRQPEGKRWSNTTDSVAPGVSTQGHGGHVLVPPSGTNSPHRERWIDDDFDLRPEELDEPPAWLADRLDELTGLKRLSFNTFPDEPIPEGRREVTLTRIADGLRSCGYCAGGTSWILKEVNDSRCEPPLSRAELRRVQKRVMRYELKWG